MDNITHFLLELFFPSFCLGCNAEGSFLCQDCQHTLEISHYNYCLCSKNPLRLYGQNGTCSSCNGKNLSGLFSALPYQEKQLTRNIIYRLKYPPHVRSLAKVAAGIIVEHLLSAGNTTESLWKDSIFVPVPMELSKMKNRGYNQAQELSQQLGQKLNVPSISHNLVKIKKTLPQMKLSASERVKNVKDAFAIKNPAAFAGKKIFLIDDVYTTGSTLEECARVLRQAGAKKVWGITIARDALQA